MGDWEGAKLIVYRIRNSFYESNMDEFEENLDSLCDLFDIDRKPPEQSEYFKLASDLARKELERINRRINRC